jgi:squalene-hopene/tetraprenyl-beta-curcumene cyclase
MPPLTGLVLTGLIDAGEGSSDAVARGIEYLLAEQREDGSWPHNDWLQANVPPDTFYILAEAARHYPAEALGRYLVQDR